MKRFACQDIIPGCSHVFTGADDQSVLDQVIAHAAQDHGLVKPPLALVELVVATTHTFVPARPRGHLRLVGAEPADTAVHTTASNTTASNTTASNTAGPTRAAAGRTAAAGHSPSDPDVDSRQVALAPWERIAPAIPFQRRGSAPATIAEAVIDVPAPTTSETAFPPRTHDDYRHECVFYSGVDGFLAAVVPFIRDGLTLGEPVMVAIAEPRLTAVREALGDDAQRVVLLDMAQLGGNPASIIPAWRDFIAGTDGQPIRGVGEPIWAGRRTVEIIESQLHEALLNIAVDPSTPLWVICPYDVTALDADIIAEARLSHPAVHCTGGAPADHVTLAAIDMVDAGANGPGANDPGANDPGANDPGVTDPGAADHHRSHALSLFGGTLPEPATPTITVRIPDGTTGDVATRVFDAATAAGLPARRSAKLAAAVDEVVYAGARNSGAAVSLRLWQDPAALVCEVGDHGTITDLLVGRGPALSTQSRDRGIRLANELCDLVQVRSNSSGTTVRMHSWL